LGPFFVLLARRRRVAFGFLAVGLAWGAVVGAGRIAQGGHWLSDVIWSAGMVYLSSFLLAWAYGFVLPPRPAFAPQEASLAGSTSMLARLMRRRRAWRI
jgi:membrane-associated phospholipid phosphatase